jgi:DNA-binding MarR family transcriptional regulator
MRHESFQRELPRQMIAVMAFYPRIYHACHTRHVYDDVKERLVSARQASILDHLDEVEPTTLRDLARHMGVTPGTMSIAIERLVRGGYVVRARDPRDRRRLDLRLTSAGANVRRRKSVLDPDLVRAVLKRMTPFARTAAVRGLALLARAANAEMHARAGAKNPFLRARKDKKA